MVLMVFLVLTLLTSSQVTNGQSLETTAESGSNGNDLFNVLLVQKADGSQELCFPLNFTEAFANIAQDYLQRQDGEGLNVHSRSKRFTKRFRKLLKLKRLVVRKLLG